MVVAPEAEQDLTDAGDWYEGQRRGRGARFLDRVAEPVAAGPIVPRAFGPVRGDYRRAVVRHFPYVVMSRYDESADVVTASAVLHTSPNPGRLLERLPEDNP